VIFVSLVVKFLESNAHDHRKNTMLKFYYAPHSCALASHIALEEAGAEYESVRLDFSRNEQRQPAYTAINPKARVPALETEHGVITETPAILTFVAQTHPAARLAPFGDPFTFAEIQAFNAYICATLHVAHAHKHRGARWADEESSFADMKRAAPRAVGACFELIENTMFRGPWVMGETYTICDPYLFTVAQWLENDGVDPSLLPRIIDHRRRMSERPAVRRAIAAEVGG
jgi:glutathione S-transferase